MRRSSRRPSRLTAVLTAATTTLAASVAAVALTAAPAQADNVVTPGSFTGYGFDQCVAPTQKSMDRWLNYSPFLAVGIYISGRSRGCRSQPNLTPRWVGNQLRKGWRLLPITLGPQAYCHPSFPRYSDDVDIIHDPSNGYIKARRQGQRVARSAIRAAGRLDIRRGSTLWYDLEGFDMGNTTCRESSIAFLSGWSWKLKHQGWKSGVYSSASSGIKMLDDARRNRPNKFVLPDNLWIARWDHTPNTSTTYISDVGWNPHRRVKQYRGGEPETWGGVTINIDRNYLDVGRGSFAPPQKKRCGGVRTNFRYYNPLVPRTNNPGGKVRALQCMLKERGFYSGPIDGRFGWKTRKAANTWRAKRGFSKGGTFTRAHWVGMLSAGRRDTLKLGSAGVAVRRLQRALNAGGHRPGGINGVFRDREHDAVERWQRAVGFPATGVMASWMWKRMMRGRY